MKLGAVLLGMLVLCAVTGMACAYVSEHASPGLAVVVLFVSAAAITGLGLLAILGLPS